jgi:hypothetical protein
MLLQRHQLRIPELLGSSKPDRHIKFTRLSSHDANTDMLGDSARHRAGPQTSIHLTVADAEVLYTVLLVGTRSGRCMRTWLDRIDGRRRFLKLDIDARRSYAQTLSRAMSTAVGNGERCIAYKSRIQDVG